MNWDDILPYESEYPVQIRTHSVHIRTRDFLSTLFIYDVSQMVFRNTKTIIIKVYGIVPYNSNSGQIDVQYIDRVPVRVVT